MPTRTHSRTDQEDVISEERSDPGSAERRREHLTTLNPGLDAQLRHELTIPPNRISVFYEDPQQR